MSDQPNRNPTEVRGVHHVAIQTRDWEGSMRLYRDVLGMTEVLRVDNGAGQFVVMLDAGDGSHVELFEQTPARAAAGPAADGDFGDLLSHLALATSDADATTMGVRSAGYQILFEPSSLESSGLKLTYSFFRGPNSGILELVETRTTA